jgi:hypothetical protein
VSQQKKKEMGTAFIVLGLVMFIVGCVLIGAGLLMKAPAWPFLQFAPLWSQRLQRPSHKHLPPNSTRTT